MRATKYLHELTMPLLKKTLEDVLIVRHLEIFHNEFINLLAQEKVQGILSLLFVVHQSGMRKSRDFNFSGGHVQALYFERKYSELFSTDDQRHFPSPLPVRFIFYREKCYLVNMMRSNLRWLHSQRKRKVMRFFVKFLWLRYEESAVSSSSTCYEMYVATAFGSLSVF